MRYLSIRFYYSREALAKNLFFILFMQVYSERIEVTLTLIVHFLLEERYTPYGISLRYKPFL